VAGVGRGHDDAAHDAAEHAGVAEAGDDRGHDAAGHEAAEHVGAANATATAAAAVVGPLGRSLSRKEEADAIGRGWSR